MEDRSLAVHLHIHDGYKSRHATDDAEPCHGDDDLRELINRNFDALRGIIMAAASDYQAQVDALAERIEADNARIVAALAVPESSLDLARLSAAVDAADALVPAPMPVEPAPVDEAPAQ